MLAHLRPAIVLFVVLSLVTGVVYPLAITGIAQVAFPGKANGSLISGVDNGKPVGSSLIGQEFGTSNPAEAPSLAKWFWGRPSATGPVPYSPLNLKIGTGSSGSNLAPSNPALAENVRARLAAFHAADRAAGVPVVSRPEFVPIDLLTSSASGLDPHISPAAAEYQVARVALVRGLSEAQVRDTVRRHTSGRQFGLLGEPVVHVLELNLELERVTSRGPAGSR